jgi:hypothetical protein
VNRDDEESGDDSASDDTFLYSLQLENRLRPDDGVLDAVLAYARALVQRHTTDEPASLRRVLNIGRARRIVQFWRWAGKTDEEINALLLSERENFFYVQTLFEGFWNR